MEGDIHNDIQEATVPVGEVSYWNFTTVFQNQMKSTGMLIANNVFDDTHSLATQSQQYGLAYGGQFNKTLLLLLQ